MPLNRVPNLSILSQSAACAPGPEAEPPMYLQLLLRAGKLSAL